MLPQKFCLPLTTEFERIKKEGRMINGLLFGILIATRNPPKARFASGGTQYTTRFGFIISTKIDKRSVVRHKIKRLLSEAVRLNLDRIKPSYDLIFLAKKTLVDKSFEEVKKEVENCLEKAGLLVVD